MTLQVPQGVTALAVSSSQVNLSWAAVSGATGYDVERDGQVIVTGSPAVSYADVGLPAGSAHSYRVRAAVDSATLPAIPDWTTNAGNAQALANETAWLDAMAAATPRVRNVVIGTSQQGRPIRATIVGPPRTRDQVRASNSIMWLGCIHGDEIAGHVALFQTIRDHAASSDSFTIIALVNVNPDGYVAAARQATGNMNGLWSSTAVDQQSGGVAYFPEQQAIRQAILLWRPRFIHDTHEYTSTTLVYRFDPGNANTTYSQPIIDTSTAAITASRAAATAAGYALGTYTGPIPSTGGTEAWKAGGIPCMFSETPQESSGGLAFRRAAHLTTQTALRQWVKDNEVVLAGHAAAATWYSGFTPAVVDSFTP